MSRIVTLSTAAALLGLATFIPCPVVGGQSPGQTCSATKLKTTAKKAPAKLACHATAARKHVPVDATCLGNAEATFGKRWDVAEANGGCATTGDKGTIEGKVDRFVDDVVAQVTGSPEGALLSTKRAKKCAASKLMATGKKANGVIRCYAQAVQKGEGVQSTCPAKAEAAFGKRWDVAEAKGGCATTGDKGTIEGKVDAFVADLVAELPPTTTTTTTSTTTTRPPVCGDGRVDPPEECDVGSGSCLQGMVCSSDCRCVDPNTALCCCSLDCFHPACGLFALGCPPDFNGAIAECCLPNYPFAPCCF